MLSTGRPMVLGRVIHLVLQLIWYVMIGTSLRELGFTVRYIARQAAGILNTVDIRAGYALMLGVGDGQLLQALLGQSELVVYCLEPDEERAAKAQRVLANRKRLPKRKLIPEPPNSQLPKDKPIWPPRVN